MTIPKDTYTYSNVNTTEENANASDERLIERPEDLPVAAAVPMAEVTAPATLPEGYKFEATIGDRSFMIAVPIGMFFLEKCVY
eukprot:CAMPEP_0116023274 /NCGR_PEP_ID=MMETSP0321-20121206/11495_1 /TAXON_ID=163516 /ORGANISM="Leptocylindrus danicus var. danicus, Strain B650" /LENGTH=82 /DNA_ID=CAMNT_0003494525 /DNA_START=92 /DNA_END=340 /DNA_ORIENTATION=+